MGIASEIDSAGFEPFHVGDPADPRAILTAEKNGLDITNHVARLFKIEDFDHYDQIYVMDSSHYRNVKRMARNGKDMEKVDYMMNIVYPGENLPVDDPWYDGLQAFEKVYKQLDQSCQVLAEKIARKK